MIRDFTLITLKNAQDRVILQSSITFFITLNDVKFFKELTWILNQSLQTTILVEHCNFLDRSKSRENL